MEKSVPFGPNIKLPSIDGITSTCEKELYVLMKEIDHAFLSKNKDLLKEVKTLRALSEEKHAECEELKSVLKSREQVNHQEVINRERIDRLLQENENLKKENASLRSTLQDSESVRILQENRLKSTTSSFDIEKEENLILKEKVRRLNEQLIALQNNYQALLNLLAGQNTMEGSAGGNLTMTSNLMDDFIAEEKERFLADQTGEINEIMSNINSKMEELWSSIRKERK